MKSRLFINQLGYELYGPKTAVVTGITQTEYFSIVDCATEKTMLTGQLSKPFFDEASGEYTAIADFSTFRLPGRYYIKVGRKHSYEFDVRERPYCNLKATLLRGFYYNRCGEVSDENPAIIPEYAHPKCHCEPAELVENREKIIDVSGGWHDSGSYVKAVPSACIALAQMLYAYKIFPAEFCSRDNIPDSPKDMPDILAECRVELVWLLKMQTRSGGVYHKVSTPNVSVFARPENDHELQLVAPVSFQATACFTAVAALASSIYEEFDKDFADLLQSAAFSGWIWLSSCEEPQQFVNPPEFIHSSSGDIKPRSLTDTLFWTVCELYSLTGEESFRRKIHQLYKNVCATEFSCFGTGGFGALAYITTDRVKDLEVDRHIRLQFRIEADNIIGLSEHNGFETAQAPSEYNYFTNINVLNRAMVLIVANIFFHSREYVNAAASQFDYILGKNPLGQCFITGVGINPVKNPHHRLSAFSETDDPVPGLLVIGVCADDDAKDSFAKWNIPRGTPRAKCYCDNKVCYSTNETVLFANSAMLFVTAFFDKM